MMKKLSILLVFMLCLILALSGCSQEKALTQEQIDAVNTAFHPMLTTDGSTDPVLNPICHFFNCYYEKPEDIDMGSFVYYIPRESYPTAQDIEELQSLKDAGMQLPFEEIENSPVPFGRIPFSTVEEYLKTYANKSLADMTNMGDAIYSEKYQSFYSGASDFGIGMFHCISGEISGNTVTLCSKDAVLTLEKVNEQYYIASLLPIE